MNRIYFICRIFWKPEAIIATLNLNCAVDASLRDYFAKVISKGKEIKIR